jgi:hypothetical protein
VQYPGGLYKTNKDIVLTELSIEFFLVAVKLFGNGNYVEAESLLKKSIAHNPELFAAQYLLGMTYGCQNDFALAVGCLCEAVHLNPISAPAHLLLGKAFNKQGLHQDAVFHLRKALELDPESTDTICTLANALARVGHHSEGVGLLESFAGIGGKEPLWHFTMATFNQVSDPQTALFHYNEALRLNPDYHEAGLNYAILLLSFGMYEIGWEAYEHRIPWLGLNVELDQIPRWHGEPLTGKVILVVTEQGFGDSIQFIRYAGLLKSRGATVHVLCTNNIPVRRLMDWAAGVDGTVVATEPTPHFDCYVPVMSLPWIFGTTLATVPSESGYIVPDADVVEVWRGRLEKYQGLRVGLVWSGNRALNANSSRSISFDEFSSLLKVEGVTFFTLQIGADALSSKDVTTYKGTLIDLTSFIQDFGDTAAFMANLDLVISVDTATAHLAGALGTPVWTLLYYPAEWRWMREAESTPWYPSMRLFRQDATMTWEPVLARVNSELEKMKQLLDG